MVVRRTAHEEVSDVVFAVFGDNCVCARPVCCVILLPLKAWKTMVEAWMN